MKTQSNDSAKYFHLKSYSKYIIVFSFFTCIASTSSGFTLVELVVYGSNALDGQTSLYHNSTNVSCAWCSDGSIELEFHFSNNLWFTNLGDAQAYINYVETNGTSYGYLGSYDDHSIGTGYLIT